MIMIAYLRHPGTARASNPEHDCAHARWGLRKQSWSWLLPSCLVCWRILKHGVT